MKSQKIVLDTNVLYAGLHSSVGASYRVLQGIDNKTFLPILSTTLLFEYEDILKRKQADLALSNQEIETILDNLCYFSEFQKVYFLWRPYLKDPKNDHVLELAVASQVKTIVTHNLKDFRRIEQFGIKAITPKSLLENLK